MAQNHQGLSLNAQYYKGGNHRHPYLDLRVRVFLLYLFVEGGEVGSKYHQYLDSHSSS